MRLRGKSAVIYGAQSAAIAPVARSFAQEGATVYLAGGSPDQLLPVAQGVRDAGGEADVAQVYPLDAHSVDEHLHQVVVKHGTVDVSLNLAYMGIEGPARLCNLTDEQFHAVAFTRTRSNFVTMAAAAREMAYQGRGTVLATAVPKRAAPVGSLAAAAIGSAAIEALCHQLREDVGSFGVRFAYVSDATGSEEELVLRLLQTFETVPTTARPHPVINAGALVRASPVSTSAATDPVPA